MEMYIDFQIRSKKADLSVLNETITLDSEFFRINSIEYIKRGSIIIASPSVVYELDDNLERLKAITLSKRTEYDHLSFQTKEYTGFVLVDDFISAFRRSFGDNFFRLRDFIQDNKNNELECYICVVIEHADHNDFPAISLSKDNIQFLYALYADLDFDIYFES